MRMTALALLILATISGCGLKGPLYMPEQESQPAPAEQTMTETNTETSE